MQDVYLLAHSGQEALEKFEHKTSLIRTAYIMWVVFLLALIATGYQDLAAALITCTALIHALAASSK
ncbi:hypothetical protein KDD30_21885 (plasmid) [Photobacterium sp. GJ3]|uniref:hypothetical protein n=1 Tax=Photobacterium sp. GJ3 TaxID=2829502 RepID=UPI001B8CF8DC|nr:hypothetical protein [Photobacterium sp. GJ3]QUJ69414.1 hypothetical protein KDD30_21885 [Photobacterium sp. GJ3]